MIRSIRSLQIFIVVAEELHFRKAAERLHMSQPPLSMHIKQLEDWIGFDLFVRTTRSVQLTPAGRELQLRASRFLEELGEMRGGVRRAGTCNGVACLNLGYPASTMFGILPKLLEEQRRIYPKVELNLHELHSVDLLAALHSQKLDVALVRATHDEMGKDLDYIVAMHESLLLAIPTQHPLASLSSIPLRALHGLPFVGYDLDRSRYLHEFTKSLCTYHGIRPKIVLGSVLPTILALVEAGIGVALVPESFARLRKQTIRYRPLEGIACLVPLCCTWRKHDMPPPVEWFVEIIRQVKKPYTIFHEPDQEAPYSGGAIVTL